MGFLSRAAESTFKKTRRRAYVPEWFRPFSYVAAAAAVVLLVVMGITGEDSLESPASGEASAYDMPTDAPTSPDPGASGSSTGPSDPTSSSPSATSSAAGGDTVLIRSPSGDNVPVPASAVSVASAAAKALFTGDFAEVAIMQGQVPPTVNSPWPNASTGAPRSVTSAPGSSEVFVILVPVDPDGGTGTEPIRDVSITVQLSSGAWVYLPYASG